MGLNYKLNRAAAILASLAGTENHRLDRICRQIRRAEARLWARSAPLMKGCLDRCQGMCCRNAAFDDIIGLGDFVYILHGAPYLEEPMRACLTDEVPFITADCPFLRQGRGPCILDDDLRPEVCITTFCGDTAGLRGEIRAVQRAFAALNRFLIGHRLRVLAFRLIHGRPRSD